MIAQEEIESAIDGLLERDHGLPAEHLIRVADARTAAEETLRAAEVRAAQITRAPPSHCTVPAIPPNAQLDTQTAGLARVVETYPSPTATAAAGMRTSVSGMTARFAGMPMVVAR